MKFYILKFCLLNSTGCINRKSILFKVINTIYFFFYVIKIIFYKFFYFYFLIFLLYYVDPCVNRHTNFSWTCSNVPVADSPFVWSNVPQHIVGFRGMPVFAPIPEGDVLVRRPRLCHRLPRLNSTAETEIKFYD